MAYYRRKHRARASLLKKSLLLGSAVLALYYAAEITSFFAAKKDTYLLQQAPTLLSDEVVLSTLEQRMKHYSGDKGERFRGRVARSLRQIPSDELSYQMITEGLDQYRNAIQQNKLTKGQLKELSDKIFELSKTTREKFYYR